ncbi:MAG: rubredoxin [Phycisphaerae bacterium]|nr:rubredoxin [Phycisphaerae bacterium]
MMARDMTWYTCTICSYGYHPMKGDPEHDIPPGIPTGGSGRPTDDAWMRGAASSRSETR